MNNLPGKRWKCIGGALETILGAVFNNPSDTLGPKRLQWKSEKK